VAADELARAHRLFLARFYHAQQVLTGVGITRLGFSLMQAVGCDEGKPLNYYAELIGVTAPVASRSMFDVSDGERKEGEPLNLIEVRVNRDDRRLRGHFLTAKGRKLVERLHGIYQGEEDAKLRLLPNGAGRR
jgi:DNA-binding MarR family transcriptional regulator